MNDEDVIVFKFVPTVVETILEVDKDVTVEFEGCKTGNVIECISCDREIEEKVGAELLGTKENKGIPDPLSGFDVDRGKEAIAKGARELVEDLLIKLFDCKDVVPIVTFDGVEKAYEGCWKGIGEEGGEIFKGVRGEPNK